MTNVAYLHTCTIGVMNLLMAMILLMHGQLSKLTSYVICGSTINIPVCIYSIRVICMCNNLLFLVVIVLNIMPITIFGDVVSFFCGFGKDQTHQTHTHSYCCCWIVLLGGPFIRVEGAATAGVTGVVVVVGVVASTTMVIATTSTMIVAAATFLVTIVVVLV